MIEGASWALVAVESTAPRLYRMEERRERGQERRERGRKLGTGCGARGICWNPPRRACIVWNGVREGTSWALVAALGVYVGIHRATGECGWYEGLNAR